jgi:hypothetical protein
MHEIKNCDLGRTVRAAAEAEPRSEPRDCAQAQIAAQTNAVQNGDLLCASSSAEDADCEPHARN